MVPLPYCHAEARPDNNADGRPCRIAKHINPQDVSNSDCPMFNNAPLVTHILQELQDEEPMPITTGRPRERPKSEPCLPARLPSSGESSLPSTGPKADTHQAFIQREANNIAPKSVESEIERIRKALEIPPSPTEDGEKLSPSSPSPNSPEASPRTRKKSLLDMIPSALHAAKALRGTARNDGPWKPPEVSRPAPVLSPG